MDTTNLPATTESKKGGFGNFLTNKEKFGGTVATVAILAAAATGLYIALPTMINFVSMLSTLLGKLIVLGGMALFVALFVYVATQPRTWTLLDYAFIMLARKATYFVIKRDPIAFLEAYSEEYLQRKWKEFMNSLQIVRQKYAEQKKRAENKEEEYQECVEKVRAIKKRSYNEGAGRWEKEIDHQQFGLESEKMTMLSDTLKKRASRIKMLEYYISILEKLGRAFDFRIQSINFKVEYLKEELEEARGTAEATRAISSIFGTDDHRQAFDRAVGYTEELTAGFVAEVENFMKMAPDLAYEDDLRADVSEQKVLALLESMDQKADSFIMMGESEQKALPVSGRKPQDSIDADFVTVPRKGSKQTGGSAKKASLLDA